MVQSVHADPTSDPVLIIGVCTRGRNALLRRLIDSLWLQPAPARFRVRLLIVDNNDTPQAEAALDGLAPHFPISIVHEPRPGLVSARNRALDEAAALGACWFVGLDDDVWVVPDWLARMTEGITTMEREIIIGRCDYVYDETLSPYVAPFQFPVREKGRRPPVQTGANFAMHKSVFDPAAGAGLRFDPYLNERGGEDTELFRRAERRHGFVAASLPRACVSEDRKGERAKLRYHLYLAMRSQLAWLQIARLHRQRGIQGSRWRNTRTVLRHLNTNFFRAIVDAVSGLALYPVAASKARLRLGSAMQRAARFVATVMFIAGASMRPYAPSRRPD